MLRIIRAEIFDHFHDDLAGIERKLDAILSMIDKNKNKPTMDYHYPDTGGDDGLPFP